MIEANVQNTESQILESAIEEFLEKGFDAARTTEIARRAGVTHAMLHYYFRTKENLFSKVFEMKSGEVFSTFLEFIDSDLPFEQKLTKGIEQHIEFLKANPKLPHFILSTLALNPSRILELKKRAPGSFFYILERFRRELNEEIRSGRIRPIEPLDLLMSIISMNVFIFIVQPVAQFVAGANGLSFDQIVERRKRENVETILARLKVND